MHGRRDSSRLVKKNYKDAPKKAEAKFSLPERKSAISDGNRTGVRRDNSRKDVRGNVQQANKNQAIYRVSKSKESTDK